MDNQTRRILLERVKASGFPGSILDVFQNPAILDQFIAEQQQSQLQQPQNIQVVAETPEQQRQGLRPYHNNNITNVEMAFPNVEANQSINTIGVKGNLDVDVIKQGNLVQSFKAIPPGIANFPTGSPEGATLIESPAKGYQKGGFHQRIYTDPEEFKIANQAYQDSLNLYNKTLDIQNPKYYYDGSQSWYNWKGTRKDLDKFMRKNNVDLDYEYYRTGKFPGKIQPINTGDFGEGIAYPIYKKPTEEPVYRERPNLQATPYKGLSINSNPTSLGDMTSMVKSSPLNYKYQLQPGVYGNQIRVGVYQDGKYQPFSRERVQNEIEENRIPDQREENYLRIQKLKENKTGGIRKYQTGRFKYQAGSEAAADATDVRVNPPVDLRSSNKLFEKLDASEKLKLRKELDAIQSSSDSFLGSFENYKRADQIMREIKSRWPEDDSLTMTEDVRMQQLGKQLIQTPLPYDNITIGQDIKDATSEAIAAKKAQDQYIENLKKKIKQTGGTKTYLKGGLKNRVLYNKAKYKR